MNAKPIMCEGFFTRHDVPVRAVVYDSWVNVVTRQECRFYLCAACSNALHVARERGSRARDGAPRPGRRAEVHAALILPVCQPDDPEAVEAMGIFFNELESWDPKPAVCECEGCRVAGVPCKYAPYKRFKRGWLCGDCELPDDQAV